MQDAVLASKFELTNFQYANQLYNVMTGSNMLSISGVVAATSNPEFWTATAYVTDLNTQLQTYYATGSTVVSLNTSTNQLTWTLPSGVVDPLNLSTMNRVLGLLGGETGSFTSTLFLVGPLQLAINSQQLNSYSYNSFPSTARICGVIPVNVGYLEVGYFEPFRDWELRFEPRINFNLLNITITDNRTGLLAQGMGEWSAVFVISDSVI